MKIAVFGFQPKNMLQIFYLPQHIVLKLFESNGTLSQMAASPKACHRPIVLALNGYGSWWIYTLYSHVYTITIFSVLNAYGYLKNATPVWVKKRSKNLARLKELALLMTWPSLQCEDALFLQDPSLQFQWSVLAKSLFKDFFYVSS